MITAEMKDKVLEVLVESPLGQHFGIDALPIMERVQIKDLSVFDAILKAFNEDGLIEYKGLSRRHFFAILIKENTHKKWIRGGYQMEEQILLQQIDLLNEEVSRLKKKFGIEEVERLTNIASNITGGFIKLFGNTNL